MKYSDLKKIFEELKLKKEYSTVYFYYYNKNDGYDEKHGSLKNNKQCAFYGETIHFYNERGLLHNEYGPAVININGSKQFILNGNIFTYIKSDEEWLIKNIIE